MQQIEFITAPDGVNLAVSTMGVGPPLVVVPSWLSHLELDQRELVGPTFFERLASNNFLVRYDKRGMGLSARNVGDYSLEAQVRDLHAIIEKLQLRGVTLFGSSQGGPIAISYAVEHADNVSRLVLYGAYHHIPAKDRETLGAVLPLLRTDWVGLGTAPMLEAFVPGASLEMREFFAEYQREAANGEDAAAILESLAGYDVTALVPQVSAPTLVLHRRDDNMIGIQQGREIASLIPGARFVPLEGSIHLPYWGDTEPLLEAIEDFLSGEDGPRPTAKTQAALQTILFTDMEGSTALTQRLGDVKAQELVRIHNRIVRNAMKAHGGTEVKHTGDGLMASFPLVSGALNCAIDIQKAVAAHNEEHAESQIGVRVGLNPGEPVAEDDDLFGSAVILAARITDRSEPGQILVSDLVRGLASGKSFTFVDQGEADLKGFDTPTRLYEVSWQN